MNHEKYYCPVLREMWHNILKYDDDVRLKIHMDKLEMEKKTLEMLVE
jgi:hypothetical protein